MKSRVDKVQEMLAIIQSKIFSLPVSYIKRLKIKIYKNNNFSSCAVWVRNFVSHFKGGTQTEGF
jgi:hypothetical protein